MELLETIINELLDNKSSLSSPLIKTKVLATRIDNPQLLQWVNKELTGYDEEDEIPVYRSYIGGIYGTYLNGSWKFTHQALPTAYLPEDIQDIYKQFEFRESVEALESLNVQKNQGIISMRLTAEQIGILQDHIQLRGNRHFQIISAQKELSFNTITQILSIVRSQLLDFVLELEKKFGSQVDIKTLRESKQEVTTIMNHTINNIGDGNVINTGAEAAISANINVRKHDLDSLVRSLQDQRVSEEDIGALKSVIDTERPTVQGRFGSKVQAWISNMVRKSLDGTWEVGIATAGGILTEILKKYYGI